MGWGAPKRGQPARRGRRASPLARRGRLVEARIVDRLPAGAAAPEDCACCGAVAAESRVERAPRGERSLIVPYCTTCHRHASAVRTHTLAVTLAGALMALTVASAMPLLAENLSGAAFLALVLGASLAPPALAWSWPRRPMPPHSAAGRAVWWRGDGRLVCTAPRWAAALSEANQAELEPCEIAEPALSPWMLAGVVLGLVAAPFFQWLYHPLVRVLDLGPDRIRILVDGEPVATVESTSAESPLAGVELRLPAGRRHLQALSAVDGRVLESAEVFIRAGAEHLWAPASDGYCFWLETTGYGRAAAPGPERRALGGSTRFWVLPLRVDGWFAPSPPPAAADSRSSGGALTALRQAPCAEAPEEVRGGR
ncbi:MAG: hypothetical protein OZ921_05060 [Sorangiineae bacterium]|nr:hypothetical protein [Sorangiineae bacterium]